MTAACGRSMVAEQRVARTADGVTEPARPRDELYAVEEALEDALSERWQYVGTGRWPGNNRMQACAFRNRRVLIVNALCGIKEPPALRVDIYSPMRGRVRIYAESKGPVSARTRQQYFTFTAESEPPPGPETGVPPLALTMSFEQLRAYEEQRYRAFLPGCFGGREQARKLGGCLGALAPRARAWSDRNRAFLERANDDWYRIVRELRALSARYGKEPL